MLSGRRKQPPGEGRDNRDAGNIVFRPELKGYTEGTESKAPFLEFGRHALSVAPRPVKAPAGGAET